MRHLQGYSFNLDTGFEDQLVAVIERPWNVWQDFNNLDSTRSVMKHKFNDYGSIKSKLMTLDMELK